MMNFDLERLQPDSGFNDSLSSPRSDETLATTASGPKLLPDDFERRIVSQAVFVAMNNFRGENDWWQRMVARLDAEIAAQAGRFNDMETRLGELTRRLVAQELRQPAEVGVEPASELTNPGGPAAAAVAQMMKKLAESVLEVEDRVASLEEVPVPDMAQSQDMLSLRSELNSHLHKIREDVYKHFLVLQEQTDSLWILIEKEGRRAANLADRYEKSLGEIWRKLNQTVPEAVTPDVTVMPNDKSKIEKSEPASVTPTSQSAPRDVCGKSEPPSATFTAPRGLCEKSEAVCAGGFGSTVDDVERRQADRWNKVDSVVRGIMDERKTRKERLDGLAEKMESGLLQLVDGLNHSRLDNEDAMWAPRSKALAGALPSSSAKHGADKGGAETVASHPGISNASRMLEGLRASPLAAVATPSCDGYSKPLRLLRVPSLGNLGLRV